MENSLKTVAPVQVQIHGLTVQVKSAAQAMESSRRLLEIVFNFRRNTERTSNLFNTLLEDVSLNIPAGTLTAILGASGSGKSILLNSMAGRLSDKIFTMSGSITFNGISETKNIRSAYLMQDDVLQPTLTVRETLQYAADLRLPPPTTKKERHAIVEEVILELGLKDCADTRIDNRMKSGCSGGERRRTSLGVQILSNPSVLYCGEPTRSLDAYSALQVIRTLKSLSQKGRTVIVSVHSPRSEIWALFDRVVLLSGGSVLYSGIADGAVPYFRKSGYDIGAFVNPAEFLVDLAAVDSRCERAQQICHLRVQRLKEAWNRASSEHEAIATTQTRTGTFKFHQSGVGFYRQIFVLTKRDVNTTLREPGGALGSIAQAIIMAVSFGMVFFKLSADQAGIRGREGALYIAGSFWYLTLMFETIRLNVEIQVFDRERREGIVSVSAFLLSRRLSKLLLEDLPVPGIFTALFYFLAGFRVEGATFLVFLLVIITLHLVAVTQACLATSISRNIATASLISNVIFLTQTIFAGYLIQIPQLPYYVGWLKWIVTNFYSYQSLVFNEFIGFHKGPHGVFYSCPYSKDPASPQCEEYTGLYIVQTLGNLPDSILRPILLSWCFPILYTIAAAAFLSIKDYEIKSEVSIAPQSDRTFRQHCLQHPPSKQIPPLLLKVNSLGLRVKRRNLFRTNHRKIIFEDISAAFPPGKLNVLLGASGSGKTSIVRILSRKLKSGLFTQFEFMGTVTINGIPVSKDLSQSAVSFVAQSDDSLVPRLTVRETLCYAAEMRLPPSMSREQKRNRAEKVMGDLGLIHCADSLIGSQAKRGISGGEKRRVSIAIQLLKDPPIIVLDEPTSGLDVFTAKSVIDVLKTLADGGRTVIMTLHQPRSEFFDKFDNILLLARGGSQVYFGEARKMLPYFGTLGFQCGLNTNPADFALDLITVDLQQVSKETESRERVDRLVHDWRIHSRGIQESGQTFCENLDPSVAFKRETTRFWQIFQVVMNRCALSIRRNRTVTIARISQVVGTSLLYALAYSPLRSNVESIQTRIGYIQMSTSLYFVGMLQNLAVYPTERDIFFDEFDDGCYGTTIFVLSYTLLELPFTIVSSFIFGALTAFVVKLETSFSMFLIASFSCFCIVTCGESLGIIFGTLFSSYAGLPIHICSTFISIGSTMGGILSLKVPMPLQAFNYLSPIKYMIASLATFSMHDRKFSCSVEDEQCSMVTGEEVLTLFKLNVDGQLNLIALGVATVAYRLIALGVVKASMHEWRMGTCGIKLRKREAKDQVSLELGFISRRVDNGFVSLV